MSRRSPLARLRERADPWLDAALAGALFAGTEIEGLTAHYRHGSPALNALGFALITLPFAWRRRRPLEVGVLVLGVAAALTLWLTPVLKMSAPIFLLLLAPYAIAAYEEDERRAYGGLAATLALAFGVNAAGGSPFGDYIFVSIVELVAWTTGRAMRSRRLLTRELERKAARIESEREDRARLAVADERTRIARELHSVVADSVSAMVVEAEAAERLIGADPAGAEAAMAGVEARGRAALTEMRRILGVLRREGEGPELAPQPGIGQVPALVEAGRAQGLDIEMRVEGEPGPLSAGVDLTVHRICQAAVHNLHRRAPDSRGRVVIRYREAEVELEFRHDGSNQERLGSDDIALRERVEIYGGSLRHGPLATGGYEVVVTLPRTFEAIPA